MVERIRDLLRRFPEDEKAVKALIAADQEFGSLCQEYDEITKELRLERPGPGGGPEADVTGLRKRLNAVEEALLRKIEGYEPV